MNIFELRLKILGVIGRYKAKRRCKKLGFCGNGAKIGVPNFLSDYSKVCSTMAQHLMQVLL